MPITKEEKDLKKLRLLIRQYPAEATDLLLDAMFWHPKLKTDVIYERRSDDTDGLDTRISVQFSRDSDSWIEIQSVESRNTCGDEKNDFVPTYMHRFRSGFGGGRSLRVRNALMHLARAIQLDEKERPDSLLE